MFDYYDIATLEKPEIIITNKKIIYEEKLNESSEVYVLEVFKDNEVIKKYKIQEEEFNVYADGENIIISHPLWSLSGIGKSLIDAERNLYKEAKEIYNHYDKYPNSKLYR